MEFTLLGSAAIGIACLYAMLWWEARRGSAADCAASLWDIALSAAIVGVFAGRLATMLADGVNPLTHPGDILIVRAGISTGWATIAALSTIVWLGRRELAPVVDGLAAPSLAGLAGWHAGCLTREACLGTPTDLPWAFPLPGSTVDRHPVELYAALAYAAASVVVAMWRARGRPRPGMPAATALVIAGGVRWATEPFRPALTGGSVAWYAAAVVGGGIALAWLAAQGRSREQRTTAQE